MKRENRRTLNAKQTGNYLIDYYNSKLTTNNFGQGNLRRELTEEEHRVIFQNRDFTGVFRNNRTYLSFLQSGNQNDNEDIVTRSLSDEISPESVSPNDGAAYSNSSWWKETSNYILRGNRNLNNNPLPIPCAIPPDYSYSDDSSSCGRTLEKVVDDGNPLITMADWNAILCEELGEAYCFDIFNIDIEDVCQQFCGSNPSYNDVMAWYNNWFFWWYDQQISWSNAGWPLILNDPAPYLRSPVWSYYYYSQEITNEGAEPSIYHTYVTEFGPASEGVDARNRTCGPGVGVFPASSMIADPDNALDIIKQQQYTWVWKWARNISSLCESENLCGVCPAGMHCSVSNKMSHCVSDGGGMFGSGYTGDGTQVVYEDSELNPNNNPFGGGTQMRDNDGEGLCHNCELPSVLDETGMDR